MGGFTVLAVSTFSDWLTETLARRELGIRQVATYVGVSHTTIRQWMLGGSRPSFDNCGAIAGALHVDAGMVRRLAGYGVAEDSEAVTASLDPQEEALLQAYRTAGPAGRRALLATAEAVTRTEGESG